MDLGQGYGEEVDLKISEDELREQILACQQEQIAANIFQFDQIHFSIGGHRRMSSQSKRWRVNKR